MRVLALHLPQFHEVPENNEWWGQGFTEWTNVKSAKPLYKGHCQPAHPLGDNYYDLSEPDSLIWQARTARKYGVDGFVFFHYWYSGKLLLEKPVDLWRSTVDADLDYALCWANHPWTRAWDGKNHQILQAQTYGGKDDWEEHLQYLLPFFRDPHYIRQEGKPLLFLYNASDIPEIDEMVGYWEERLVDEGFSGIYIVEYISSKNPSPTCSYSQAVYEDEPVFTLRFGISAFGKLRRVVTKSARWLDLQNYDHVWHLILRKKRRYSGRKIVQGAFVAGDVPLCGGVSRHRAGQLV